MSEFILTTSINEFENLHKFGKIGIDGMYCCVDKCPLIIEGILYNDVIINKKEDVFSRLINANLQGAYNIIFYDTECNKIYIKNDEFAFFPIYVYMHNEVVCISNNVWNILKKFDKITIDLKVLYMHFEIFNCFDKNRTFFSQIQTATAGTVTTIDLNTQSIHEHEYADDRVIDPNGKFSLEEMALLLDVMLKKNYAVFKKKLGDELVFFGNSGGLDSRLIPHYAKNAGIKVCGFTIGQKYELDNIKTSTFANAEIISNIYNFKNYEIDYAHGEWFDRLLLDIRNAPFLSSDLFKNPYLAFSQRGGAVFCGQPALTVGTVAFKPEMFDKPLQLEMFCELFCKVFSKDTLQRLLPHTTGSIAPKHLYDWLRGSNTNDILTLIKRVTRMIISKHVTSCGGFESCNRTFFSIPHYSNYPYELTNKYGNKEIFMGRAILKTLINLKFKGLAKMPTQQNIFIQDNKCDTQELENLISIRGTGLNYTQWGRDKRYFEFAKSIWKNQSDTFNKLFYGITFSKLFQYLRPYNINEFLKVKYLLHIIEYRKFYLLEKKEFTMASRFEQCGLQLIDTHRVCQDEGSKKE